MNLNQKANDPRRLLMWGSKSIANCSKQDLMECVIHLSRQVAFLNQQVNSMLAVMPKPPEPVTESIIKPPRKSRNKK